jgi:peptide/nickel transport system ATP-binding protein
MDKDRNGQEILAVKNLVIEYHTAEEVVQAVNDVTFSLRYGETLGLVGETGAGKTTIARAIMRILPLPAARIMGGEIKMDGTDVYGLSDDEVRKLRGKKMSMVFQDPMTALNPVMRIGNQIVDGIVNHEKIPRKAAEKKAMDLLEMVGIPAERFREFPHQFSGGMKQRVVIAIALACNPDLLIADEPTTALDVTIQATILNMISQQQKERNMAMIIITHDFGIVAETCDNVAVVYAGQIIEYGTKRQIFNNAKHPYTIGLFAAIPNLDTDVERLTPIAGSVTDPTNLPHGCYFHPRCEFATHKCKRGVMPMVTFEDGHQCRCIRFGGEPVLSGENEDVGQEEG